MDGMEISVPKDDFQEHDVAEKLSEIRGNPIGTEARVCDDIANRQRLGIIKYGVTVEKSSGDFRDWLQHAYEEALDMAIYLKRAIEEIEG